MPTSKKSGKAAAPRPELKLRMRISLGELVAVGPGKVALLEALEATGSITAAAKSLDMSYRRAWLLIAELNRALRQPAVSSAVGGQRGGGSQLTATGREVMALYRSIEAEAMKACQADIRKLMKLMAS